MRSILFDKKRSPIVVTPITPRQVGAPGASKIFHGFITEGGVVNGDSFPRCNQPTCDQIQPCEPSVGVARMVERLPLLRSWLHITEHLIGNGVGILMKPLFLLLIPMVQSIALAHQHMGLLFIALDNFTGLYGLGGIHAIILLTIAQ